MDARLTMDRVSGMVGGFTMPTRVADTEERLPFTIRVASGEEQLAKAVSLRYRAYGRHVPQFAELLRLPEPNDAAEGCVVLLAESKLDGEALGTLRIQTNRFRPLALESSVTLPAYLRGRSLAEATRLAVTEARTGRVVKTMLFKAFYLYCLDAGIDWLVIGARPPLDRMYEALLFSDLFPGEGMVPLKHAGDMPHRILGFEIETAEARWLAARHPMYGLFVNTRHPDIDLAGRETAFAWRRSDERLAAALAA
jgi:hypothetical protein